MNEETPYSDASVEVQLDRINSKIKKVDVDQLAAQAQPPPPPPPPPKTEPIKDETQIRLAQLEGYGGMLLERIRQVEEATSDLDDLHCQVAKANAKPDTWPPPFSLPDGEYRYQVLAWTRTVAEDATGAAFHWMPDWDRFHA